MAVTTDNGDMRCGSSLHCSRRQLPSSVGVPVRRAHGDGAGRAAPCLRRTLQSSSKTGQPASEPRGHCHMINLGRHPYRPAASSGRRRRSGAGWLFGCHGSRMPADRFPIRRAGRGWMVRCQRLRRGRRQTSPRDRPMTRTIRGVAGAHVRTDHPPSGASVRASQKATGELITTSRDRGADQRERHQGAERAP